MANFDNPQTDALKLVIRETVQRGWFTPAPTINAEEGFILEHYRGNTRINTYASYQLPSAKRPPDARDGDTLFRLNLGPRSLTIDGSLSTWEGYKRPYHFVVDIQIRQPTEFFTLYRQEADPVAQVARAIIEALQKYASRTIYEDIHPLNFVAKVQSIFDSEPGRCKAGMAILEVHDPALGVDPNYRPVKIRQIVHLKGNLPTQDGYERGHEVDVELEVIDIYTYKRHELEGESPLTLVQVALHDDLQRHAYTLFYEEQTAALLQTYLETQALNAFLKQSRAGMRVVRAYNFQLGTDVRYKPVPKIQRLTLTGTLRTREKYERPYRVGVELQVANLSDYLRRTNENTAPLGLAQAAIEGEILQFAASQSYETLTNEVLLQRVAHAFDKLDGHATGGMKIRVVHFFDLRDAKEYVTVRVVEMDGVIDTSDILECPYTLTVEMAIGDAATFVQLTNENTDPLNLVKEAIAGSIVKMTRGKPHDEVIKLDLTEAADNAFKEAQGFLIAGLRLVKAHKAHIQVDDNIRARAVIGQVKETDLAQVDAKKGVLRRTQDAESELRLAAEDQNYNLAMKKGDTTREQLRFDLERERMKAMSQGYTEFFQKVFQIEIENLEIGNSTYSQVLQNIQSMLQITESNAPRIGGQANANGQAQLQGNQQVPALKPGQPAEQNEAQVIEAGTGPQPIKITWPEAGLMLMEVPLPAALLPYMGGNTHAFQIQKIEAVCPARQAGLRRGDFLVGIGEEEDTYTTEDFNRACKSVAGQDSVLVCVRRSGPLEFFTLHFSQDEEK